MLESTRRAIVLAAGRGTRLNGHDLPKPLKPIAGVPLLVRILQVLQCEGITEAVIVLGHQGDRIRRALEREPSLALDLRFVTNKEYDKKNGVSVLAAASYIDEGCLLTMADHLYSPEVVRRLRATELPLGACALAVDYDIERCFDIDDATKVVLQGARIDRIGKEIEGYNAVDVGVFRIGPALVDALARVYEHGGDCSLSDGVAQLAREGRMMGCDIGDARWIDVDTPEALRRAEAMLHVFGESLGDEPSGGAADFAGDMRPESMELFAPSWVRAVEPYNEDHFEVAARKQGIARLMSNESPYAPSARVLEAIMEAAMAGNHYPSRTGELRRALGERFGLDEGCVLLGAGSAELIDLVVRTFVAPGEEVLLSVPTFSMYEARTRTVGGIPVMVQMTDDGAFDVPGLIAAITERTKLIFLCTPNNPTGNCLDEAQIRRVLRLGLPTVIDEAYAEFNEDSEGMQHLLAQFPNAIVLRTFSKAFGLAGMRVGYLLGHPVNVRLLSRVKVPWNLSSLAIAATLAALDDEVENRRRLTALRQGRALLERELAKMPGVEVMPSEANFVLVEAAGSGLSADTIVERMLQQGIFIRSLRSHRGGRSLVRITVGSSDQNRRCIEAFRHVVVGAAVEVPAARVSSSAL